MLFALLGALAIGVSLGLFGSGGSILTVPVLLYVLRHEDKAAIAESLGIVGAIALIGAVPYALGRLVHWKSVLLFGIPAIVGTYLGAMIAAYVAGYVQILVFAGVMLLASHRMWKSGRQVVAADTPHDEEASRHVAKIVLDGVLVGMLTGFVGVGGGFLIVPALVLLGGLDMRRAIGTSLLVIAMKSAIGFWKYLDVLSATGDTVDWDTIGVFIGVGAVGSAIGKRLNTKLNQSALRRGFAVFLLVMALFIIVREAAPLLG